MPVTNKSLLYTKALATGKTSVSAALIAIRDGTAFDTDGVIKTANQTYLNNAKIDYTSYLVVKNDLTNLVDDSNVILDEYKVEEISYVRDYVRLIAISKAFGVAPV